MTDQFLAEIRILPYDFAPLQWAPCDGAVLPISSNTALFSLLGTTYGGDGRTTFALPDLRGALPMHPGQGPGLTYRELGETGGTETVQLLGTEMPAHTHALAASAGDAGDRSPAAELFANQNGGINSYAAPSAAAPLAAQAVSVVGGDQPHNNLAPYATVQYCIALQGIYPPRS